MEGYKVVTARNGEEALAKARLKKPDLILLDIMMPGNDGFQVLEQLKQDLQLQAIPVVFVTALIQETMKIKGKQLGATDFVIKSEITPAQLVAKIKEYFSTKEEN
jgi:twitching motility two-component system response regulator PilH